MKNAKLLIIFIIFINIINSFYPQIILGKEKVSVENVVQVVDRIHKEEDKYLIIDIIMPEIQGLGLKGEEINKEIEEYTDKWLKEIIDASKENLDANKEPMAPYSAYVRYTLQNTTNPLSFYIEYYQYTGGAHGITTRVPYNIDIISGNKLSLKDLFEENYDFKEVMNKKIYEEVNKNKDMYFYGKEGFNGIKDDDKFFINNKNIVIYYGQYEIAPYAAGMPEFIMPFNIFKNNYVYDKIKTE